jgi:hypothetical protein
MKNIFIFIVFIFLNIESFSQSRLNFFAIGKLGVHSDIPNEQVSFGGGAGFGMNLSNQPNRWQAQLNLDYFSLNSADVARNGFRSFSMMFQFGRIWSLKLNENANLGIGGGVVGVIPFESKENPSFQQNALPAAGFYIRFEYPISIVQGKNMYLIMDNSVFGDGFMRNVFGISYPLGRTLSK